MKKQTYQRKGKFYLQIFFFFFTHTHYYIERYGKLNYVTFITVVVVALLAIIFRERKKNTQLQEQPLLTKINDNFLPIEKKFSFSFSIDIYIHTHTQKQGLLPLIIQFTWFHESKNKKTKEETTQEKYKKGIYTITTTILLYCVISWMIWKI